MTRIARLPVACLLAGVLASLILGCGSDSGSPSTPTQPSQPSSGAINVLITPMEVIASLQSPLTAEWWVAITEAAGVSGNVDFVPIGRQSKRSTWSQKTQTADESHHLFRKS